MSLKAKLPIWVFITVAAIGIAVVILLLQYRDSILDEMKLQSIEDAYWTKIIPRKDELSGWETYRNEEYGFEFKYPDEIDIKEATNKLGKEMVLSFKPCTELPSNETTYCKTTIKTLTSEESLTNFIAKEFYLDKFSLGQQDEPEGVYIEKATINGGDIESYKISVPGMLPFTNYYTKNKDRLIIITNGFIWYGTELEKIGISGWNLFNQILSTFKFIEPIDTSDWETYRNEEYGFEVKYPAELNLASGQYLHVFSIDFEGLPAYIMSLAIDVNNYGITNLMTGTDLTTVGPLGIRRSTERGKTPQSPDYTFAVWEHPKTKIIFSMQMSSLIDQRQKAFEFFDQILSTFKFIP